MRMEEWFGLVKDPRRAAWKAQSCYGGDAGQLLDLCRARLVFPEAGGAAACLRAVAADPGARVLRVRNGMRDDGVGGGGFRVRPPPPLALSANKGRWCRCCAPLAVASHACVDCCRYLCRGAASLTSLTRRPSTRE